jgi:DNA-binding beta-propeller fold protein YncE
MRLFLMFLAFALVCSGVVPHRASAQPDYTLFESGPVRPIALSPSGDRLFVVNTPDAHLEVFDISSGSAVRYASIPVGLEPVAVAARNDAEVWVVNHLSDSVSIVDVAADPPRVVRTLLVGDEPRDIVFAGAGGSRAFITTAHRGQNAPHPDGEFGQPGTGRADVWVFNADALGDSLLGAHEEIITLFGDRPRPLAVSPDRSRVYAGVFRSGNQTVAIGEANTCDSGGPIPCTIFGTTFPASMPLPWTNGAGDLNRETGLIVGFDGDRWRDEAGNDWGNAVKFELPDYDVFEIDANAATPAEIGRVSGVGTVLFNMIVHPTNGNVYVTNTEANNRVRFEGRGEYVAQLGAKPSGDPPSVRGNLHRARVTVLDASADNSGTEATEFTVRPRHLNTHIEYGATTVDPDTKDRSLATPLGMAISEDGDTLYVVGFGSNAVGRYELAQLDSDGFEPTANNMIPVPEQPAGIVLDDAAGRLYVATRYILYVVDAATGDVIQASAFHTPEDNTILSGRKFLYDAKLSSGNGEASCSSCHVFADMDDLPWDLGDPDLVAVANPNPSPPAVNFPPINVLQPFDPLKGPMATQSLRGLVFSGPMHWRGDRTGPTCTSDPGDPLCANEAFNEFAGAFEGLLGRESPLAADEMQEFTDFILRVSYPPNPIRNLDNSLTALQQAGRDVYFGPITDQVATCNGCHTLDRAQGAFGTAGGSTFEMEEMEFKVPHLRNAYQKVGMFGNMPSPFLPAAPGIDMGMQVRGSGFLHDGSVDRVLTFLGAGVFTTTIEQEEALEAFIMAFDTDLAPIVGQQVTLRANSGSDVTDRVALLIRRADEDLVMPIGIAAKECDLIVKGVVQGEKRGWVYRSGEFAPDRADENPLTPSELTALAAEPGQPLTFTCAPPGSGDRMGIDRDRDGILDGDDANPEARPARACRAAAGAAGVPFQSLYWLLLLGLACRLIVLRSSRNG